MLEAAVGWKCSMSCWAGYSIQKQVCQLFQTSASVSPVTVQKAGPPTWINLQVNTKLILVTPLLLSALGFDLATWPYLDRREIRLQRSLLMMAAAVVTLVTLVMVVGQHSEHPISVAVQDLTRTQREQACPLRPKSHPLTCDHIRMGGVSATGDGTGDDDGSNRLRAIPSCVYQRD
ncbi:hypothetical protein H671_21084 [Cricetulus griseus]|nr:hypothetical protein H671_21084 [Cricetulus griseus]